jgi:hypothetical protein
MGQLWDSDPDTQYTQPVCRAFDVIGYGTASESRTPMPSCDEEPGAIPCLRIRHSPLCQTDRDYELRASPFRTDPPPAGSKLVVECLHRDWAAIWSE